jgi:hypothetical protein
MAVAHGSCHAGEAGARGGGGFRPHLLPSLAGRKTRGDGLRPQSVARVIATVSDPSRF